jgi:hypothetical protein
LGAHALKGKVFGFTEIDVVAFGAGKIFVAYHAVLEEQGFFV